MKDNHKAYALFWNLYNSNNQFEQLINKNMTNGKIRFFGSEEWEKISSQNFISPTPEVEEFIDMFNMGYNIGNCVGTSWQLSYSYDDVDIVSGTLPILKGTRNAEMEGGHRWLENEKYIIDTSLLLVIDKSLKIDLGYREEERLTSLQLLNMSIYQQRKQFVNDKSIRKSNK